MKLRSFIFTFTLLLATTAAFSQTRTVGTIKNTNQAFDGYTLFECNFSGPSNYRTYLIDNCGDTVHSWQHVRKSGLVVKLLENGNLLRAAHEFNPTINAGGTGGYVQLIDWDNNVLWEYKVSSPTIQSHHDVEYMPNGNVLILAWEKKNYATCIQNGRNPALLPDSVIWTEKLLEVQPIGSDSGVVVWQWDAFDHLIQDYDSTKPNYGVVADHPELLNFNYTGWSGAGKDWLHANSINYNPTLDQIAMSFRTMHEIYIIDHSTTTAQASSHSGGARGKGGDFLYRWGNPEVYGRASGPASHYLWAQHDCHWIPAGRPDAGKIMIFNNGTSRDTISYSSVDIINPPVDSAGNYVIASGSAFAPALPEWSYTAPLKQSFYAAFISGAQRLSNGNTLIDSGTRGRFFEINSSDSIVWEYINPVTSTGILNQYDQVPSFPVDGTSNWVFRAYKYEPTHPAFVGKTLTPGSPVELNPVSICAPTSVKEVVSAQFTLSPTVTTTELNIYSSEGGELLIMDIAGHLIKKEMISKGENKIFVNELQAGVYLAGLPNSAVKKFVKVD